MEKVSGVSSWWLCTGLYCITCNAVLVEITEFILSGMKKKPCLEKLVQRMLYYTFRQNLFFAVRGDNFMSTEGKWYVLRMHIRTRFSNEKLYFSNFATCSLLVSLTSCIKASSDSRSRRLPTAALPSWPSSEVTGPSPAFWLVEELGSLGALESWRKTNEQNVLQATLQQPGFVWHNHGNCFVTIATAGSFKW